MIKLVDIASLFNDVQFGYLYLSPPSQDLFSFVDDLILGFIFSDLQIPVSFCSARDTREKGPESLFRRVNLALFLYGFLPDLRGQLISVAYPRRTARPRDPK